MDFYGCAWCFKENIDASETDPDGTYWTYCRACDEWTEHPPIPDPLPAGMS